MTTKKGKINWSILLIIVATPFFWAGILLCVNAFMNLVGK